MGIKEAMEVGKEAVAMAEAASDGIVLRMDVMQALDVYTGLCLVHADRERVQMTDQTRVFAEKNIVHVLDAIERELRSLRADKMLAQVCQFRAGVGL